MKKGIRIGIYLVSAALITLTAVRFGVFQRSSRIVELEKAVLEMRSTIHMESMRQYQIQKVMAIIRQYNVKMPQHESYEIAEEIFNMTQKYNNLNVDLICATISHESAGTWNPEIKSPAGALGLMQIMPATGMFIAAFEGINWSSAEEVLCDPIYNIRIGSRYLSSLIDLYDVDGGLAAYNGGEHRAALWIGSGKAHGILFEETASYVPAIQRLYQEFRDFRL